MVWNRIGFPGGCAWAELGKVREECTAVTQMGDY